jgi:hypothetical protein
MSDHNTNHNCCTPTDDIRHDCCSTNVNKQQITASLTVTKPGLCPECGNKGKKVDSATVKSMLAISLRDVRDTPYFFCREADCDTVYFSEDGTQTFGKQDVRERVFQKEPDADDVQG